MPADVFVPQTNFGTVTQPKQIRWQGLVEIFKHFNTNHKIFLDSKTLDRPFGFEIALGRVAPL